MEQNRLLLEIENEMAGTGMTRKRMNAFGELSCKTAQVVLLLCSLSVALRAQTFTALCGLYPGYDVMAPLIQATDGNLYGTAYDPYGTIFRVTLDGTLTTIYSFCSNPDCTDGEFPSAALVQGKEGGFYGVTSMGGTNHTPQNYAAGTIFKVTPSGNLTTLYNFCSLAGCTDGYDPIAGLVQPADGLFYGVTTSGGANFSTTLPFGGGTVFKITANGKLTTVYSFCPKTGCSDGYSPIGGLLQTANGNLYGTTAAGGANNGGTVFKITPSGTLTTLYSFCAKANCVDGQDPNGALVRGSDGAFYGTTASGGLSDQPCNLDGCGTVFRVTETGSLTTLYSFCSQVGCTDGFSPNGNLVAATDGAFYGTTGSGGAFNAGTIFKISSEGVAATLYSFCYPGTSYCTGEEWSGGAYPSAGLVQDTNGDLYGTTAYAGEGPGVGVVFSLSAGLGAFVEPQPTSGKAGETVKILGDGLTGATSVTFNGTKAVFTVASGSLITTTVPAGATNGEVEVTTPGGTLSSNVPFLVRQ